MSATCKVKIPIGKRDFNVKYFHQETSFTLYFIKSVECTGLNNSSVADCIIVKFLNIVSVILLAWN